MEEVQGPTIVHDMLNKRSNSCFDSMVTIRGHDAVDDDEANIDGDGQLMSMEQSFEFLEGSMQADEGAGPKLSELPVQSDPFHHDWPYWNAPEREIDAA
jgi:hypothetical protein